MRAAHLIQYLLSRLQTEMIRIIQAQRTPSLAQLVVRKALDGGLSRDGHEDGEWDGAMREGQGACAGFCCLSITAVSGV